MAAIHHIGFIVSEFGPLTKSTCCSLNCSAKFGQNRWSSFCNASFNILHAWLGNAYSRPILGFWGHWPTKWTANKWQITLWRSRGAYWPSISLTVLDFTDGIVSSGLVDKAIRGTTRRPLGFHKGVWALYPQQPTVNASQLNPVAPPPPPEHVSVAIDAKPEVDIRRRPKKLTFWPWFPISSFRQNVTDRQTVQTTDRQTTDRRPDDTVCQRHDR